jgi:S1-C subfamily serine protease
MAEWHMRIASFALAVALVPTFGNAQDASELIAARQLAAHIMQVGADTLGSAVALGAHSAITNCHVLGTAQRAKVMRGGLTSNGNVVAGDTGRDLCLLQIEESPAFPVELRSSSSLEIGEKVYALGFSGGRLSIGIGKVQALYSYDGGVIILTDATFAAGASGGGLFDRNQKLVGVLTFYRHGPRASSYWAMPTEWINELTASNLSTVDRSHPPIWSAERTASIRFLEVAGYEVDGDWDKMRQAAAAWMTEEPGSEDAARALMMATSKLTSGIRAAPAQ